MSKNVLSIEAFAEFCEAQGDREYDYTEPTDCAFCQYLKALGIEDAVVIPNWWRSGGIERPIPAGIQECLNSFPSDWNFRALASRLRSSGGQTDG